MHTCKNTHSHKSFSLCEDITGQCEDEDFGTQYVVNGRAYTHTHTLSCPSEEEKCFSEVLPSWSKLIRPENTAAATKVFNCSADALWSPTLPLTTRSGESAVTKVVRTTSGGLKSLKMNANSRNPYLINWCSPCKSQRSPTGPRWVQSPPL